MENEHIKENVTNKNQWLRVLYMILFAVVLYLVMFLVSLIVVVQLIFALFSGKRNEDIAGFATDLSHYVYRIVAFLTYTDDVLPFPFSSWGVDPVIIEENDDDYDYMTDVEDMGDVAPNGTDTLNRPDNKPDF